MLGKGAEGVEMLFRKNFCRRHEAGLESVVDGYEARQEGYEGLARTYIALHQSIHLLPADEVASDFPNNPFLRFCELKGQVVFIKSIKMCAHSREVVPALVLSALGVTQNFKLKKKSRNFFFQKIFALFDRTEKKICSTDSKFVEFLFIFGKNDEYNPDFHFPFFFDFQKYFLFDVLFY
jgi:hypothetical protein